MIECVRVNDNICIVRNILKDETGVFLVYQSFLRVEHFFKKPLESGLLGINKVSELSDELELVNLASVQTKNVLLPYKTYFVSFPFTDCVW